MTISVEVLHPSKEALERAKDRKPDQSGYPLVSVAQFARRVTLSEGEHLIYIAPSCFRNGAETIGTSLLNGQAHDYFIIWSYEQGRGGTVMGTHVAVGQEHNLSGALLTAT